MAITNIYNSIFGVGPSAQQAAAERSASFQDMLNSRRRVAEQQRTDDVKMARYNAFGNLLTTMVQPVGWGIGGGFTGSATGGYQPYDNRQYLAAFNRAVKAADDIRNIGTAEDEYRFKVSDENYRRALSLEDEQRRRDNAIADYERQRRIAMNEEEAREKARMERLQQEYDLREQLAKTQTEGRLAVEREKAKNRGRSGRGSRDGRESGGLRGDGRESGGLTNK